MQGAAQHAPDADRIVLLVNVGWLLNLNMRISGCCRPPLEITDRAGTTSSTRFELNTAAKPFLIEKLMKEGYVAVVCSIRTFQIHSPLDGVWRRWDPPDAVVTRTWTNRSKTADLQAE